MWWLIELVYGAVRNRRRHLDSERNLVRRFNDAYARGRKKRREKYVRDWEQERRLLGVRDPAREERE
jgi:hypothetical protein